MKLAIISDTHCGIRNDSVQFMDYQERFFNRTFFPYCVNNDITTILHLGDMFDRRKYINHHSLERFHSMFVEPVMKYGMQVYVTVGNHDVYWKNTNKVSSVRNILGNNSNFHIIDINPMVVNFDGTPVGLVPWITEDNHDECMNFINTAHTKTKYVFGHFEIKNFEMMRGTMSTVGVDRDIFGKYDLVGSGHYHTKSEDGPIVYFGTQMEFTWSDFNDKKYFHVFDTENKTVESIQNPEIMFCRVFYDDVVYKNPLDIIKDCNYSEKCVRIIVKKKENLVAYENFIKTIKSMNPFDLVVMDEAAFKMVQSDTEFDDYEEEWDNVPTTIDVLNQYVDGMESMNVDIKEPLKTLFGDLYIASMHKE